MKRTSRAPQRRRVSARRIVPALLAAAAAAALVAQTGRALERIGASKRVRAVMVMSGEMERMGRPHPQLVGRNLQLMREAGRLDPSAVAVPVAMAGQYMLLGRYEAAIEVYEEALELEPRPEIYLNLGNALRAAGRPEEAREAFATAVRLAPGLRSAVPADMRP